MSSNRTEEDRMFRIDTGDSSNTCIAYRISSNGEQIITCKTSSHTGDDKDEAEVLIERWQLDTAQGPKLKEQRKVAFSKEEVKWQMYGFPGDLLPLIPDETTAYPPPAATFSHQCLRIGSYVMTQPEGSFQLDYHTEQSANPEEFWEDASCSGSHITVTRRRLPKVKSAASKAQEDERIENMIKAMAGNKSITVEKMRERARKMLDAIKAESDDDAEEGSEEDSSDSESDAESSSSDESLQWGDEDDDQPKDESEKPDSKPNDSEASEEEDASDNESNASDESEASGASSEDDQSLNSEDSSDEEDDVLLQARAKKPFWPSGEGASKREYRRRRIRCDICDLYRLETYYHCDWCYDFDLCPDCVDSGEWCFDRKHNLRLCDSNGMLSVQSMNDFLVQEEIKVFKQTPEGLELVTERCRTTGEILLYQSPPVMHPDMSLAIWPNAPNKLNVLKYGDKEERITHTYRNASDNRSSAGNRYRQISVTLHMSNGLLFIGSVEACKVRTQARPHKIHLRLQFFTKKIEMRDSSLHNIATGPTYIADLGEWSPYFKGDLPFSWTWTPTAAYFSISDSESNTLRALKIELPSSTNDLNSVYRPFKSLKEVINLPRSAKDRSVHFYPSTAEVAKPKVILGPRYGDEACSPIVMYLEQEDFNWTDIE